MESTNSIYSKTDRETLNIKKKILDKMKYLQITEPKIINTIMSAYKIDFFSTRLIINNGKIVVMHSPAHFIEWSG